MKMTKLIMAVALLFALTSCGETETERIIRETKENSDKIMEENDKLNYKYEQEKKLRDIEWNTLEELMLLGLTEEQARAKMRKNNGGQPLLID